MACAKNFCRLITYLFYLVLFLAGLASVILGGVYFGLFAKKGIKAPVFVPVLLIFGAFVIVVNLIGCCGSRRNSRVALALYMILTTLSIIAQACFAAVIFAKPSLVAGYLETEESNEMDSMLKNPGASAGTMMAIVVGFQILTIVVVAMFRTMVTGEEADEEDYWNKVQAEKGEKRKEMAYEKSKTDFEMKAREKVAKLEKKNKKKGKL